MKSFDKFSNEEYLVNEGLGDLISPIVKRILPAIEKWIPKVFNSNTWKKIIGFAEVGMPAAARVLTTLERKELTKSLSVYSDVLGAELVEGFINYTYVSADKLVIASRGGGQIELKYIFSMVEQSKAGKLNKEILERFIKILPERFKNGELCASRFRQAMSGNIKNVPKLSVTKGIRFSPNEDSKILRNIIEIEKYWDKSKWTQQELQRGYKEIVEELDIAVSPDEYLLKKIPAEEAYNKWIEYLNDEVKLGMMTQTECDDAIIRLGKLDKKNWSLETQKLPDSIKYLKRIVRYRIWDKQSYLKSTGKTELRDLGNCETVNVGGKTEKIINILPENYPNKPSRDELKNLFYHEISHGKDVALNKSAKYSKSYKPVADETIDGKGFYKSTTRGKKGKVKEVMKEWDFYKNYFIHTIENKVRFRASLEDMKFNANEWLTNRVNQYRGVGWNELESRKRGMVDTINWLKSVNNFLKSSSEYMDAAKKQDFSKVSQEGKESIHHFWELVSTYKVGNANYEWLEALKKDNPKGFKEYSKKLATQIDEWIDKLSPQAFESSKFKYLKEFREEDYFFLYTNKLLNLFYETRD